MSLTDAVKAAAGRMPGERGGRRRQLDNSSLTQSVKAVASHKRKPPSTREGRTGVLIYFDRVVAEAIRRIGAEFEVTNQELGQMAFKLLFEKYDEPWPV